MTYEEKFEIYTNESLSLNDIEEIQNDIKEMWIEFGKRLKDDEYPKLIVSEEDWDWFGNVVSSYVRMYPHGTECRRYPRVFFRILSEKRKFVENVLKLQSAAKKQHPSTLYETVDPAWVLIGGGLEGLPSYN